MTPTTHKENGREAERLAQAQAHVCAPAHENARTFNVRICMRRSWTVPVQKERIEDIKDASVSTLVRIIAHKHALGYRLDTLFRNVPTGTYIVTLEKETMLDYLYKLGAYGHVVGASYLHNCPVKDSIRSTQEARE